MSKPRLLDLFCGAGGAAMGYHRAGFEVVGVDIAPQPHYPFEFVQADALDVLNEIVQYGLAGTDWGDVRAIHASPPCQAYGSFANLNRARWGTESRYPKLIEPVRAALRSTGWPYVIENTERAPLQPMVTLCGSMFGLRVRRHRLFETNLLVMSPGKCRHRGHDFVGVFGDHAGTPTYAGADGYKRTRRAASIDEAAEAMCIDWMSWREICEAIPPAYTEWIGEQLLAQTESRAS